MSSSDDEPVDAEGGIRTCPMCRGKGYCDNPLQDAVFPNVDAEKWLYPKLPNALTKSSMSIEGFDVKPQTTSQSVQTEEYEVQTLFGCRKTSAVNLAATRSTEVLRVDVANVKKSPSANRLQQAPFAKSSFTRLNTMASRERLASREQSRESTSKQSVFIQPIIKTPPSLGSSRLIRKKSGSLKSSSQPSSPMPPVTRDVSNPQFFLENAMKKVRSDEWDIMVEGIKDVLIVVNIMADLVVPYMRDVVRVICKVIKSMRSNAAHTACQSVIILYSQITFKQRPEFDELMECLLMRTSDINHFIRDDANLALDAVVASIPPQHSMRVLRKGVDHKNALVRCATSRLMLTIVKAFGADNLFAQNTNREFRRNVLLSSTRLVDDGDRVTRAHMKSIFKMLISHEDFERYLLLEVPEFTVIRIKPLLVKYKCEVLEERSCMSLHSCSSTSSN